MRRQDDDFLAMLQDIARTSSAWQEEGLSVSVVLADDPKTARVGFVVFAVEEEDRCEWFSVFIGSLKHSTFVLNSLIRRFIKTEKGRTSVARALSQLQWDQDNIEALKGYAKGDKAEPWRTFLKLELLGGVEDHLQEMVASSEGGSE